MKTQVVDKTGIMALVVLLGVVALILGGCSNPKYDHVYRVSQARSYGSEDGSAEVPGEPSDNPLGPPTWTDNYESGAFSYEIPRGKLPGTPQRVYHVDRGDILSVSIYQLERLDKDSVFKVRVDQYGQITLPLLNGVPVAGLTCDEVRDEVAMRLSQNFMREPRVMVSVYEYGGKPVLVMGAVGRTGTVYLEHDSSGILEVLAKAYGIRNDNSGTIKIIRGGYDRMAALGMDASSANAFVTVAEESDDQEVLEVPVGRVLGNGDMKVSPVVHPGDMVYVVPMRDGYFYVAGEVDSPGAKILNHPLTLMQAVVSAGDTRWVAAEERCRLLRTLPTGEEQVYSFDLNKVRAGEQENIRLARNDMIIVPTDPLKKFLDELDQLFRRGVSTTMKIEYDGSYDAGLGDTTSTQ